MEGKWNEGRLPNYQNGGGDDDDDDDNNSNSNNNNNNWQVKNFKCLICEIFYENEKVIPQI